MELDNETIMLIIGNIIGWSVLLGGFIMIYIDNKREKLRDEIEKKKIYY